jgi:hypothetical protein
VEKLRCHLGGAPCHTTRPHMLLKRVIGSRFHPTKMAHIPRLSKFLSSNSPRICLARFSSSPAVAYTDSPQNTLDGHRLLRSAHEPSLIVYDAPSQPSENLTRRSARSPNSLTDYYNARRRLASHPPRQVRSSTSNSVTSTGSSPLNSVPHPENVHARIFDSPSKPREYYTRPQPKRDLPELRVRATNIVLVEFV